MTAKNMEKTFNEIMTMYILATMKDIRVNWEDEDPFPAVVKKNEEKDVADNTKKGEPKKEVKKTVGFQHYDNIILLKETRLPMSPVVTISQEVKGIMVRIFERLITEVKNIEMVEGDTLSSIKEKLIKENNECLCKFLIEIGERNKEYFGQTLENAGDAQQYFSNKIVGNIPMYKTKPSLTAILFEFFDKFLKSISWSIAKSQWYNPTSVNKKYFLAMLNSMGLDQIILYDIEGVKTPKKEKIAKPATKRTKKPVANPQKAEAVPVTANAATNAEEIEDDLPIDDLPTDDLGEEEEENEPEDEDEDKIFA